MNNKKVHWSQYADEISFLTIQDTVPLSDSVDDDYFSEESADFEPLEKMGRKRNKRNQCEHYHFFPMDEYSLLKSSISGKSDCNHVYDSNYFKESDFLEREKGCHHNYPRAIKEDICKMRGRWRDGEYGEENSIEDDTTYSNYSDDKSTLSPRSYDDSSDSLGSPRKSHDNYWISPPIALSKKNSNVSRGDCIKTGRLNSDQKSEDRLSRISSGEKRGIQNVDECHYGGAKFRPSSHSRRDRSDYEEKLAGRRSSKVRYEFIAEDMKPNLPQPRVKLNRSTSEKPNKTRSVAKRSSKGSKKSNSA
ncbi:unnamed protein product [Rodentolepis nana]|uniref:Ovule protein n=1 Tax=Rodentolepis nana TaxID=102285 RepID=A0A0R3TPY5_RODNA|nr:unnamed protein product [Rodentolepis nana]